MDLSKSYEFFHPEDCGRVHIIGVGAIGSTLAEFLARLGLTKISLYDFDTVEAHNIANQMFRHSDIGKTKVEAMKEYLIDINPDIEKDIELFSEGYTDQMLYDYVFLAVDNIDLRREIATNNRGNRDIKAMFDFRVSLLDAQHYGADWKDPAMIKNFLKSMDFSHEEAKLSAPVSACNLELSVAPTIRTIVSEGVTNFMHFVKGTPIKKVVLTNPFEFSVQSF